MSFIFHLFHYLPLSSIIFRGRNEFLPHRPEETQPCESLYLENGTSVIVLLVTGAKLGGLGVSQPPLILQKKKF